MSRKNQSNTGGTLAPIGEVEFDTEMRDRFVQFGTYVNATRGVVNVIDGLKPVHRRILWAMYTMNALPGRPKFKSMDCIGQITRYHPHGDAAIYTTMTHMAHVPSEGLPFKRPVPMIEGQGSWGDLLNGAAAPRYTECSLTEQAVTLLGDGSDIIGGSAEIKENGVDLVQNYSGRYDEPTVLPALWPNFVVNPNKGIGVGVSMDTAGHNLVEVMNLAIRMVDSPNPRMETVWATMPGPDMPTDCDIFDNDGGIESYYTMGIGSFTMRARVVEEPYKISPKKNGTKLVVEGLPYQVSPESVVEGVSIMVGSELLPQDIEVSNYTDVKGIRVVIDIKENDPKDIMQRLLYHGSKSRLQLPYHVNSNAVVDGSIRTIGTLEAIREWIDHRRNVVRRRSRYRMERARARLEVVDGFLRAIPIADKIVEMVRQSDNRAQAEATLQTDKWGFTAVQATAILDMTLSQLTKLSTDKYLDEKNALQARIDECQDLLDNPRSLDTRLKKEMRAVRDKFGYPRRCRIREGSAQVAAPEAPAIEVPVVNGYLVRTGDNWVRWATRTTVGKVLGNDHVVSMDRITDANMVEGISNVGWHYRVAAKDLPDKMIKSEAIFRGMDAGEKIVLAQSGSTHGANASIVTIAQKQGEEPLIKRVDFETWATLGAGKSKVLMKIEDGWSVTHAFFQPDSSEYEIALLTGYGKMLRFPTESIVPKGRSARGIAAMKLSEYSGSDSIVWAGPISNKDSVIYWTSKGTIGRFSAHKLKEGSRHTQGSTVTRSDNLIKGAIVGSGTELNYFDGSTDAAQTIPLTDLPDAINLANSQMKVSAKGLVKAKAVWLT